MKSLRHPYHLPARPARNSSRCACRPPGPPSRPHRELPKPCGSERNGKSKFTQNVGHSKSDAFRLAERFRRADHDHLVIDMTYYDPKAWGDKFWPGFHKYYKGLIRDGVGPYAVNNRAPSNWHTCSPEKKIGAPAPLVASYPSLNFALVFASMCICPMRSRSRSGMFVEQPRQVPGSESFFSEK